MKVWTRCITSINLAPIHSSNKVIYLPRVIQLLLYWKNISGHFFPQVEVSQRPLN